MSDRLTLVVEDGSGLSTANTYVSLDDATTYQNTRLHTRSWEQKDDEDKERALVWATRLLDQHCRWKGDRSTLTQALRWPRCGVPTADLDDVEDSDAVPTWLANATAELARLLLEKDRPAEAENQRVVSSSTGRGSRTLGPPDQRFAAVIPPSVMSMVAPYVKGRSVFRIERV